MDAILKIRKTKNYRNPTLDNSIRKQRTIKESHTISEVKSFGISAPLVYFVNLNNSSIIMQHIPGKPLHDLADSKIISLSKQMGRLRQLFNGGSGPSGFDAKPLFVDGSSGGSGLSVP